MPFLYRSSLFDIILGGFFTAATVVIAYWLGIRKLNQANETKEGKK